MSPRLQAILFALASAALGSTGAAATKHASPVTGIATLLACQYLVCTLLLLPRLRAHLFVRLPARVWAGHVLRGLTGFLCLVFFYMALSHIPLADSVLLRNAAPLWVPVLGIAFGVSFDRRALLPALLGLAGVALVMKPGQHGISPWHLVGLLSGVAFALSMHFTRQLTQVEPQRRILLIYFLVALACAIPWAIITWKPFPLSWLGWLLYTGVSLYLSLVFFTRAYSLVPTQQVAPIAYTTVLFAVVLDALVWGHYPDGIALAGMALVIGSGVLLAWRPAS